VVESEVRLQEALRRGNDVITPKDGLTPKTLRMRHTLVD